jgi:hypothetical protein
MLSSTRKRSVRRDSKSPLLVILRRVRVAGSAPRRWPRAPRLACVVVVAAALAIVAPAPAAQALNPTSFSFLRAPTDQLGVPGYAPGTELTPEMNLFTGYTELSFEVGRGRRSFLGAARILDGGRYPIVRSTLNDRGVQYTISAFEVPLGGRPVNFVRLELVNTTRKTATAQVLAAVRYAANVKTQHGRTYFNPYRFNRPPAPTQEGGYYYQPGSVFTPKSKYRFAGNALVRDGGVLWDYPSPPPSVQVKRRLRPHKKIVNFRTRFGETTFKIKLLGRARTALEFRMPVVPVKPGSVPYRRIASASFLSQKRRLVRMWQQQLAGATGIDLPERKVTDTFYTSLVNILMPRYRNAAGMWVQAVNKLRYQAFWLRDVSVMTNALDLAGLTAPAGDNFAFALSWQKPDGLLISRQGQLDGFGETLWALGEHVFRAGDSQLAARAYSSVQRAMAWFERARAGDPLGLIPAADPDDNEEITGHITGDNFWAVAGIKQAIKLAQLLGNSQDAATWSADLNDFTAKLRAQVNAATARTGGWIPPALDVPGGQDWGNLWAAYPGAPLGPADPAVTATLAQVRGKYREGIATYADGLYLHGYLGFRAAQTELLRGEQGAVIDDLYSALAHTTGTNAGFESGVVPLGSRDVDNSAVPHGWWAAEYVSLLRNMLVREEGNAVVLMSAVSPSWLTAGRTINVRNAPTLFGPVTYTLKANANGAQLTWSSSLAPGTALRWQVPAAASEVQAPGLSGDGRAIVLAGAKGSISVRWRLGGPLPSFVQAINVLTAQYRQAGKATRPRSGRATSAIYPSDTSAER